jgi:hypothetical protein
MRRLHRDERGQSLAIILSLITVLFLMGTALAAHISVALKTTVANETQAGDLNAADTGAELGMWWQRNGNLPAAVPTIVVNGLNVTTTAVVTGAVPCPTQTPVKVTGFEHGAVSIAGAGIFSALAGTGTTADSAVARSGSYSLKVTDPAASANNAALAFGAPAIAVVRIYIRLAALPAANVTELVKLDAAAGNDLILGYLASTQRLTMRFGATAVVPASSVASAGTWYRIDMRLAANTNPRTGAWQIDGVPQTALTNVAGAASTVSTVRLGSTVAADNYTANYDDVLISATSGDYPIGAGTVVGLRPDGMGTSNTPGSFRNDDGTAIDANTYLRVDESPMTTLTDYVTQQTIGATNYVELSFGNTGASCIVGVSALIAYHAAGTPANTGKTSIYDGATERIVFNGDMSVTPLTYASVVVAPASAPWTPGAVNGLQARIGYSSDVTPNPYWDALVLEVATGVAVAGTVTVTSTAASVPIATVVTTTYTDVGAAMPTLLSWSTNR